MTPTLEPAVMRCTGRSVCPQREHTSADAANGWSWPPLDSEADVDDRSNGQAQQPVECRRDAHVVLLARSVIPIAKARAAV